MSRHDIKAKVSAKSPLETIKRTLSYLRGSKRALSLAFLMNILVTGLTIYSMKLMGEVVDTYIIHFDKQGLLKVALFLLGLFCVTALFSYLEMRLTAFLAQRLAYTLRKDLFSHLLYLPMRYFDKNKSGDIMSRFTNDVDNVNTTLSQSITAFLEAGISLVGMMLAMLLLSPVLSFYALLIIPLTLISTKIVVKYSRLFFQAYQKRLGTLNAHIEEELSAQKMLRLYNHKEESLRVFYEQNEALTSTYFKAQSLSALSPLMSFINNFAYLLVTVIGAIFILDGKAGLTVGVLFTFLLYMRRFARPLNDLATLFNSIQSGLAGAERIFELLDEALEETEEGLESYQYQGGEITFDEVSFSYEEAKILDKLSFTIYGGKRVALVGATGSGKTTIASLIARFYEIDEGRLLIDGKDIRGFSRKSLREMISFVPQDSVLFESSVYDNIRYAKPSATKAEVMALLERLGVEGLFSALPEGLDTMVTEGGQNLSKGMRQLVAISRSALSDSPILVLDEATSNIDTKTEKTIQNALDELTKGRTSLIIAHRLATIREADHILVLDHGKLLEEGNHKNLIEKNGHYAEMVKALV